VAPNLAPDVARFHAAGGPALTELFQEHQLAHLDETLTHDLAEVLASSLARVEPAAPAAPDQLPQAVVLPLPAAWHELLAALALLSPALLTQLTRPPDDGALRRALTLLLRPESQRRVTKVLIASAASDPLKYGVMQTELVAAATCWRDILRVPSGDLRVRAETTLLLHAVRAFRLIVTDLADMPPLHRKAIVYLGSVVHAVAEHVAGNQPPQE
jgi:hypothetical protein